MQLDVEVSTPANGDVRQYWGIFISFQFLTNRLGKTLHVMNQSFKESTDHGLS